MRVCFVRFVVWFEVFRDGDHRVVPWGVERGCVRTAHYFTNGFEINDHTEGLIFYLYTNKAFKSTRKNTTRTVFKRFISEINEHNQHGT